MVGLALTNRLEKLHCKGVSLVDYTLFSTELLVSVKYFEVDVFDSLLSDIHWPICITLTSNGMFSKHTQFTEDKCKGSVKYTKVKWDDKLCNQYREIMNVDRINGILSSISYITIESATPDIIDALNSSITDILLSAAIQLGMAKGNKTGGTKLQSAGFNRRSNNTWFNKECKRVRRECMSIRKCSRNKTPVKQVRMKAKNE